MQVQASSRKADKDKHADYEWLEYEGREQE